MDYYQPIKFGTSLSILTLPISTMWIGWVQSVKCVMVSKRRWSTIQYRRRCCRGFVVKCRSDIHIYIYGANATVDSDWSNMLQLWNIEFEIFRHTTGQGLCPSDLYLQRLISVNLLSHACLIFLTFSSITRKYWFNMKFEFSGFHLISTFWNRLYTIISKKNLHAKWAHSCQALRLRVCLRVSIVALRAQFYILCIHASLFLVIGYWSSSKFYNIVNVNYIFSKLINLLLISNEKGNSIYLRLYQP